MPLPVPGENPAYDAESRVPTLIAVLGVVLGLSTLCTVARLYTRQFMLKSVGADDWACVVALLFAIATGACIGWNSKNGLGSHFHLVVNDQKKMYDYLKAFYVSIVLYNTGLAAIKVCFLLQYRRILAVGIWKKIFNYSLVFIVAWSISQLGVTIFNCIPVEAWWDQSIQGKCVGHLPWWYINAAGNIVTDAAIFCLPIPLLLKLKLGRAQKVALVGIFSLGFFTCAVSIIRIQYLFLDQDPTWDNVPAALWSVAEVCCGIICACLPTLRPLLAKVFPFLNVQPSTASGGSRSAYGKISSRRPGTGAGGTLISVNGEKGANGATVITSPQRSKLSKRGSDLAAYSNTSGEPGFFGASRGGRPTPAELEAGNAVPLEKLDFDSMSPSVTHDDDLGSSQRSPAPSNESDRTLSLGGNGASAAGPLSGDAPFGGVHVREGVRTVSTRIGAGKQLPPAPGAVSSVASAAAAAGSPGASERERYQHGGRAGSGGAAIGSSGGYAYGGSPRQGDLGSIQVKFDIVQSRS